MRFIDDNTEFSKLRGNDLLAVLKIIDKTLLVYRNTLGFDPNILFGTEIEYQGVKKSVIDKFIKSMNNGRIKENEWLNKDDGSITIGGIVGGEINSPKLTDCSKDWNDLAVVCRKLRKLGIETRDKAGGHIHIDENVLEKTVDNYRKLYKFIAAYESILYRFGYGDKIRGRYNMYLYATPVAKIIDTKLDNINNISNSAICKILTFPDKGFRVRSKGTFEFRLFNTSDAEEIWQNNINTAVKMLLSIPNISEDFFDEKFEMNRKKFGKYIYYNDINLLDALEFVDLVFDNNLDKIYFLKQYFKNYEVDIYNSDRSTRFCKSFIKRRDKKDGKILSSLWK